MRERGTQIILLWEGCVCIFLIPVLRRLAFASSVVGNRHILWRGQCVGVCPFCVYGCPWRGVSCCSQTLVTGSRQLCKLKSQLLIIHFLFFPQFQITRVCYSLVFPTYFLLCTQIVVLFLDPFSSQFF